MPAGATGTGGNGANGGAGGNGASIGTAIVILYTELVGSPTYSLDATTFGQGGAGGAGGNAGGAGGSPGSPGATGKNTPAGSGPTMTMRPYSG